MANKYVYNSPYAFSENKVTAHVELEGAEALEFAVSMKLAEFAGRTASSVSNIKSGGTRLISNRSGSVPSEVPMSNRERQVVKIGGQATDAKMVTDGIKDIAKTGIRMSAETAQSSGDAIETAGIVTGQLEIAAVGKFISLSGKAVNMTMDAAEGNLTLEDATYEVVKEGVSHSLGKFGEKNVEAGNLAVAANNVWQGIVKGWEKITDLVKEEYDDKNKSESK